MIPPLKPNDPVTKAQDWMNEFRLSELPVVDRGDFLGILSEDTILEADFIHDLVKDYDLIGINSHIKENQHFYDLLKLASNEEVKLVAVINESGNYSGIVSVEDMVLAFAETSAIRADGAILELKLQDLDYSLSDISRIVESNDAKIFGSYVTPDLEDPKMLNVTIKLSRIDLSHIVATLEASGYKVISEFGNDHTGPTNQDRLDGLFKYLSV